MNNISPARIQELIKKSESESSVIGLEYLVSGWTLTKMTDLVYSYRRFMYYLAKEMEPRVYLELGIYNGQTIEAVLLANDVTFSIGVDNFSAGGDVSRLESHDRFSVLRGNTIDRKIIEDVMVCSGGVVDLMFIDSLHNGAYVKKEFNLYRQFLREGSIVVFDDADMHAIDKTINEIEDVFSKEVFKKAGGGGTRDLAVIII